MVTLITEKLQNQSLDDLARKTYDGSLCPTEKLNRSGSVFPFELHADKSPWKVVSGGRPGRSEGPPVPAFVFSPGPFAAAHSMGLQWRPDSPCPAATPRGSIGDVSLAELAGQPLAPPTKRHCRSLSEPDELARCRSPWRPGGSKVWTPVSKRRCNSGGSATLQRGGPGGLPRGPPHARPAASPPAAPRPASAGGCGAHAGPGELGELASRRRLSLSQEHLAATGLGLPSASSTPGATPEPGRRQGLLRSRSQPCVLDERPGRRKRRRDEDARWPRPALDFLKMTRTLKNSKSLCSLDYDDDEDTHAKTVVSSPCDSQDLPSSATPGSSPARVLRPWTPRDSESAGVPSDGDSAEEEEEGVFPLDCADLDLEQIENN